MSPLSTEVFPVAFVLSLCRVADLSEPLISRKAEKKKERGRKRVSERIEAAIHMRAQAQRLRQIANIETHLSSDLILIAQGLEDEARKLESATIPDLPKPSGQS
jgi:hypothetical protein